MIEADTPAGRQSYECEYLLGCDGLRSAVRDALGIEWLGYSHADRFLIADIRTDVNFPRERRFYFDARSNPGRQIVVHAQPGNMWRFDWQLPPDSDALAEQRSGKLDERIRDLTGDVPYEIDWLSTYRFHQRCAARIRVGRVFLAGDAAHAMPPFGARGMNSGIQDIDNLAWKLKLVQGGIASPALLESYQIERHAAAHENLAVTESTIRFMVPPTRWHRLWRDSILAMGRRYPPLGALVNSGQMSRPNRYRGSPIVAEHRPSPLRRPRDLEPGNLLIDASCRVDGTVTRLRKLASQQFIGLYFCADVARAAEFARAQAATALDAPMAVRLYIVPPVGQRVDLPVMAGAGGSAVGSPVGSIDVRAAYHAFVARGARSISEPRLHRCDGGALWHATVGSFHDGLVHSLIHRARPLRARRLDLIARPRPRRDRPRRDLRRLGPAGRGHRVLRAGLRVRGLARGGCRHRAHRHEVAGDAER